MCLFFLLPLGSDREVVLFYFFKQTVSSNFSPNSLQLTPYDREGLFKKAVQAA